MLIVVMLLTTLRYKPDALPRQATGLIPVAVQQRVRRDYISGPVHFTNPVFGDEGGLNQNTLLYGAMDEEPLHDFNNQPSGT